LRTRVGKKKKNEEEREGNLVPIKKRRTARCPHRWEKGHRFARGRSKREAAGVKSRPGFFFPRATMVKLSIGGNSEAR